jgi:replicative DNA helicase
LQEILKEPLGKDVYENITDLVEKLQNIDLYRSKKAVETKDACVTYMNELDERRNERNREMKIGIDKFDKTTGGFHRKELTVIGARPSVGKSALALQIACELACQKFKVLFVSLEMSEMQILERMVAKYSRVEHEKLREGNLEKKDMDRLSIGTNEIARRNFTLTTSIRTIGELRAQAVLSRPDIIILDYVGLLKDTSENWRDKRTEISSITRKLKLMTLDLNLPIVILAQLSRSAQNKEPILSELRDSGSLEEDADNVLFVHRLSAIEAESKGFGSIHQCEYLIHSGKYPTLINIEKHRNGATGYIRTLFHSNRFTFEQTKDEKRIG